MIKPIKTNNEYWYIESFYGFCTLKAEAILASLGKRYKGVRVNWSKHKIMLRGRRPIWYKLVFIDTKWHIYLRKVPDDLTLEEQKNLLVILAKYLQDISDASYELPCWHIPDVGVELSERSFWNLREIIFGETFN